MKRELKFYEILLITYMIFASIMLPLFYLSPQIEMNNSLAKKKSIEMCKDIMDENKNFRRTIKLLQTN